MMHLTDDARKSLDRYLSEVRESLRGYKSVDVDEVERDIREHIESELQGLKEPISVSTLGSVLERLGNPTEWVTDDERPDWLRPIVRVRSDTEDYRLAYLSFGAFVLCAGLGIPLSVKLEKPWGFICFFVLFLLSFVAAKVAIFVAYTRNEMGPQRWLIYPGLITGYLALTFLILFWSSLLPGIPIYSADTARIYLDLDFISVPCLILIVYLIWRRPALLKWVFLPFADCLEQRWGKVLFSAIVLIGLLVPMFAPFLIPFYNLGL